jgi:hypothetical protein
MRRLAAFARVIVFDKRGAGLSDPVGEVACLRERALAGPPPRRTCCSSPNEGGELCLHAAATLRGLD